MKSKPKDPTIEVTFRTVVMVHRTEEKKDNKECKGQKELKGGVGWFGYKDYKFCR